MESMENIESIENSTGTRVPAGALLARDQSCFLVSSFLMGHRIRKRNAQMTACSMVEHREGAGRPGSGGSSTDQRQSVLALPQRESKRGNARNILWGRWLSLRRLGFFKKLHFTIWVKTFFLGEQHGIRQ